MWLTLAKFKATSPFPFREGGAGGLTPYRILYVRHKLSELEGRCLAGDSSTTHRRATT